MYVEEWIYQSILNSMKSLRAHTHSIQFYIHLSVMEKNIEGKTFVKIGISVVPWSKSQFLLRRRQL